MLELVQFINYGLNSKIILMPLQNYTILLMYVRVYVYFLNSFSPFVMKNY